MVWGTPSSGGKGTWPSAYSEGLTECLLSVVCRQFLFPGPFAGIKLSPSLQPLLTLTHPQVVLHTTAKGLFLKSHCSCAQNPSKVTHNF